MNIGSKNLYFYYVDNLMLRSWMNLVISIFILNCVLIRNSWWSVLLEILIKLIKIGFSWNGWFL